MPTIWYSDAFHSTGIGATARDIGGFQAAPGTQGGMHERCRVARIDLSTAAAVAATATNDVFVMIPVKPKERIRTLQLTTDNGFNSATTYTVNIGLARLDPFGNLALLSNVFSTNMFATLVVVKATTVVRIDAFLESGTFTDLDRMKSFWDLNEIINPGFFGATPPKELWAITAKLVISGAVSTGGKMMLEAEVYRA